MGAEAGRTIERASPAMFIAMAIFALAFVILLVVNIPEPMQAIEKEHIGVFTPLKFRHLVFGIIALFIYVGIEIGIPSIATLPQRA